jgi:hypothetical protein
MHLCADQQARPPAPSSFRGFWAQVGRSALAAQISASSHTVNDMGMVRGIIDYFRRSIPGAHRGSRWWAEAYNNDWSVMFGGGAANPRRDEQAWRVVVEWASIPDASDAYERWKRDHELNEEQLHGKVRREVRGNSGGQMRVIVSPDLVAAERLPRA